jgi:hypothetical protein
MGVWLKPYTVVNWLFSFGLIYTGLKTHCANFKTTELLEVWVNSRLRAYKILKIS